MREKEIETTKETNKIKFMWFIRIDHSLSTRYDWYLIHTGHTNAGIEEKTNARRGQINQKKNASSRQKQNTEEKKNIKQLIMQSVPMSIGILISWFYRYPSSYCLLYYSLMIIFMSTMLIQQRNVPFLFHWLSPNLYRMGKNM